MEGAPRRKSMSDELYQDVLNGILSGQFAPNSKLPTEARLAHDYGISRSTVRGALGRLREEGYIASRQGSGSVVLDAARTPIRPFAPVESLADLELGFECRISLEGEIAYYVALRHDDAILRFLDDHLATFRSLIESGEFHTTEDTEFHMSLAAASRNHLFESIMVSLRPYILFGMNVSKTLSRPSYGRHAYGSFEEHKVLIDAIRSRDGDAARAAMRHHLEMSRRRLFGGDYPGSPASA
ncbi:MAG: FadR family transcriptional regulator [Rhodospirillales bacterium]|nr:FadR family transcriptional regulator [Rhodospirillales bacterium]